MGLITTQNAGFGSPKPDPQQAADPKPVTGFNYAGQLMRPGEPYNGRPEHMDPTTASEQSEHATEALQNLQPLILGDPHRLTTETDKLPFREGPGRLGESHTSSERLVRPVVRRKSHWTLEKRAALSEKVRAWHRDRKAGK